MKIRSSVCSPELVTPKIGNRKSKIYLTTFSARMSTTGGIVRPRVLAVLRLIISCKLRRLLNRKVSGLGALQNLVDHHRRALVRFDRVRSVGHQTADSRRILLQSDIAGSRFFAARFTICFRLVVSKRARRHDESGATRLNRLLERALEFVGAVYLHGMKLQTQFLVPGVGFLSTLASSPNSADSTAPQRGRA